MSVRVVASAEVVAAFALAGVEGRAAGGRGETVAAIEAFAGSHEVKILAVEEANAELARDVIDRLKLDAHAPLVVELPGIAGPLPERQTALDLVRQALGLRL